MKIEIEKVSQLPHRLFRIRTHTHTRMYNVWMTSTSVCGCACTCAMTKLTIPPAMTARRTNGQTDGRWALGARLIVVVVVGDVVLRMCTRGRHILEWSRVRACVCVCEFVVCVCAHILGRNVYIQLVWRTVYRSTVMRICVRKFVWILREAVAISPSRTLSSFAPGVDRRCRHRCRRRCCRRRRRRRRCGEKLVVHI